MPFFYVAGNHDYTNEVMENEWFKRFGSDYYHFLYKNILFICLNSEHGHTALIDPDLGEEQVKFVEKILRKNRMKLTVLRAGIIVGSGSASFEIIRDLCEKLPIMITPKWVKTKSQPIAIRNVIEFSTNGYWFD